MSVVHPADIYTYFFANAVQNVNIQQLENAQKLGFSQAEHDVLMKYSKVNIQDMYWISYFCAVILCSSYLQSFLTVWFCFKYQPNSVSRADFLHAAPGVQKLKAMTHNDIRAGSQTKISWRGTKLAEYNHTLNKMYFSIRFILRRKRSVSNSLSLQHKMKTHKKDWWQREKKNKSHPTVVLKAESCAGVAGFLFI